MPLHKWLQFGVEAQFDDTIYVITSPKGSVGEVDTWHTCMSPQLGRRLANLFAKSPHLLILLVALRETYWKEFHKNDQQAINHILKKLGYPEKPLDYS